MLASKTTLCTKTNFSQPQQSARQTNTPPILYTAELNLTIMTRGTVQEVKVQYRGRNVHDDFIVYASDVQLLEKWKTDKTIPLAEVLGGYKAVVTHK
jgi:hypothetical protein